jgi:hypothetical protein
MPCKGLSADALQRPFGLPRPCKGLAADVPAKSLMRPSSKNVPLTNSKRYSKKQSGSCVKKVERKTYSGPPGPLQRLAADAPCKG